MCTAISYKNRFFGRNLDYDFSYGEEIVITPRNYTFKFRRGQILEKHYAMIGIAYVVDNYPLYYDAVNEKGLGVAGLNFVGNAVYLPPAEGKDNIAQFEFIPWLLGQCASVKEARSLLGRMNFLDASFNKGLPASELHWMIADGKESIVVESVKDGLKVYDNPVNVLTNNPPFNEQFFKLNDYQNLSNKKAVNRFAPGIELEEYSRGMGAIGLPGDFSSSSRFVKAAFVRAHSVSKDEKRADVNQFFHLLHSVEQPRGACELERGRYEITLYSDCYDLQTQEFYYTNYDNHQISMVSLHKEDLDGMNLYKFPLVQTEQIHMQN